MSPSRITVVVATRNRREQLIRTLDHLSALPERPPVIVVDNGSDDGTQQAVQNQDDVTLVQLSRNAGALARNMGVALAKTPYVAFADDDSWWAPGALGGAADLFDQHARLGLVAARVLVGPGQRLDSMSALMKSSPLPPEPELPGTPVLGFLACGAIVRREAFLAAGGFNDLLFFFGEEALLAVTLRQAGWGVAYVDEIVAHHHPEAGHNTPARRQRQVRNHLLTTAMCRPRTATAREFARHTSRAAKDPAALAGVAEAVRLLPRALTRRVPITAAMERQARAVL